MTKMIYTAPEMTVTELESKDIMLISVDDENVGNLPEFGWDEE